MKQQRARSLQTKSWVHCSLRQFEDNIITKLREERQKNMVLQQKLIQKEAIIRQLKTFHEELSQAFQDCQLQLSRIKNVAINVVRQQTPSKVDLESRMLGLLRQNKTLVNKLQLYQQRKSVQNRVSAFSGAQNYASIKSSNELFKGLQYFKLGSIKTVNKFMICLVDLYEKQAAPQQCRLSLKHLWRWVKTLVHEKRRGGRLNTLEQD